jgi:hypothetical protein
MVFFCYFEEFLHRKISILFTPPSRDLASPDIYFIIRKRKWPMITYRHDMIEEGLFSLASLFITLIALLYISSSQTTQMLSKVISLSECFFVNDIISISWKKSSILSKASPVKVFYIISFSKHTSCWEFVFIVFSFYYPLSPAVQWKQQVTASNPRTCSRSYLRMVWYFDRSHRLHKVSTITFDSN